MKIIFPLLLCMSFSGSFAFFTYLLICFLSRERIPAFFRYTALKLCLALYLFPFPAFKYIWLFISRTSTNCSSAEKIQLLDISHSFVFTNDGILLPQISISETVFLALGFSIMLCIILSQTLRFIHFRHQIYCHLQPDSFHKELLFSIQSHTAVKQSVQLFYCDAAISPFTFGIKKPVIVLTPLVSEDNIEMALKHELQHIKSHDFFYRILGFLVILLHCFNPLSYVFFKELREIQEMNCDELLMKSFSNQERCRYGEMILTIAMRVENRFSQVLCLSKDKRSFLRKRILHISAPATAIHFLVPVMFLLICTTAAIPVYAYSPQMIDFRSTTPLFSLNELENTDWIEIDSDSKANFPADEGAFQYCDTYYLLENGTVIPEYTSNMMPFANCKHNYQSALYKQHIKNGKNCVVKTYRVRRCSKCGSVKNRVLISTGTNTPCPHK